MFRLTVCDHIMIAHSFRGEVFGPARRLHGATFVVEAEFSAPRLDDANLLVDIGLARAELRRALEPVDYRNLDDLPSLSGQNTTTEFMARHVFDQLREACWAGRLGEAGTRVTAIKVVLRESPLAWASFEGPIG